MRKLRIVRGAEALSKYLREIGCPMSEATIYRLIKNYKIPFRRPSQGILVFDLNAIDTWLVEEPLREMEM